MRKAASRLARYARLGGIAAVLLMSSQSVLAAGDTVQICAKALTDHECNVIEPKTTIYKDWSEQFNLSHCPCGTSTTAKPTARPKVAATTPPIGGVIATPVPTTRATSTPLLQYR